MSPTMVCTTQIPLIYQNKNDLYCVQAQYKPINASDLSVSPYIITQSTASAATHTCPLLALQPSKHR